MNNTRWSEESEEVIELVYRIQADYGGSLRETEAHEFGPWAASAAKRAERINWLVAKGTPPILKVTYGGRKALDAALAIRSATTPQPHWFGGSVVPVDVEYGGPVILPESYKPYNELKEWAQEQGILTQDDIDRVAHSKKMKSSEQLREFEEIFPGTRWFVASLRCADEHPLGDGLLDPEGHEGPYQVTVTLARRGAPDVPSVYVADAYRMEGDSHLLMREEQREDGAVRVTSLVYTSHEGDNTEFQLLADQQGRLGQIRTVLRATSAEDARKTAYRLLNPFLCDLSYSVRHNG